MRLLLPVLLITFAMFVPRVISDKRPLPGKGRLKEKAAEKINRGIREYELIFDSLGYANKNHEDSLMVSSPKFSGFDKGLNSSKESFFVTNNSDDLLSDITIDITYLTIEGAMLHKRRVSRSLSVPPGETHYVDIPSWDTHHQFYYFRTSPTPKREATPFQVRFEPVKATYITH